MQSENIEPYVKALDALSEDATYTAQAYFEAAKSAEFWGRTIVFFPALSAGLAGALVALNFSKGWGVISALSGVVAATASFLGAERKAPAYKESAKRYTQLRHSIRTTIFLASETTSLVELASRVEGLESEYRNIAARDEPVPNRLYQRAAKRIKNHTM